MSDQVKSGSMITTDIIKPLAEKVAILQEQGNELVERLQQFGWPDTRADRTPDKVNNANNAGQLPVSLFIFSDLEEKRAFF